MGEVLGCFGHLIKLVRIKAGNFEINESIKLSNLETAEQIQERLIYPTEYLNYPQYELSDTEKELVSHGMAINTDLENGIALLTQANNLIAVATVENKKAKMSKVFI